MKYQYCKSLVPAGVVSTQLTAEDATEKQLVRNANFDERQLGPATAKMLATLVGRLEEKGVLDSTDMCLLLDDFVSAR